MNTKTEGERAGVRSVYTLDQLSDEAKAKALAWFNEVHDDPMLQAHLGNLLKEELDAQGIGYEPSSINALYSLSSSQGDGFMFEGTLEFKGHSLTIEHSGRYYHSNSKQITWNDFEGEENEKEEEKIAAEFEEVYQAICKTMEQKGYDEIEYQSSMEFFEQECEGNEYTFTNDGKRLDADAEE